MARARVDMAAQKEQSVKVESVSIDEAKRYIQKAANDSKFTLAARELSEMSDEDILRLYQQIRNLESVGKSESESS